LDFTRDSFAFANETYWEYHFDRPAGKNLQPPRAKTGLRAPLFRLDSAARQFLFHATFEPNLLALPDSSCRRRVRKVLARPVRAPCEPGRQIINPGIRGLAGIQRRAGKNY